MNNYEFLEHYGMPRRSGRYPWGSGENPYQHSRDWLSRVEELEKEGMSKKEIAEYFEISTTDLQAYRSIAVNERRAVLVKSVKSMKDDGYSNTEIAQKLGLKGESTVRSLLNKNSEQRMNQAQTTALYLKEQVEAKGMIDVGKFVNRDLNISQERLDQALSILQAEGYPVYGGRIPQPTNPGKMTTLKVLCPPGTAHKDIYNTEDIRPAVDYSLKDIPKGEQSRQGFLYPESLDSKRLMIRYADDPILSGTEKDGIIELRRGVDDISLGKAHYAQVRIMVDGTHYLKGMAVYSNDMPKGVDVIFNTNKTSDTPALGDKDNTVLKLIKKDPDNPFGSLIKEEGGQSYCEKEVNKDGSPKLRVINKRADEGDWDEWSHELPSQFLAKQNKKLIQQQLYLTETEAKEEFDSINSLTNPVVRKQMLNAYALKCEKAAVHLKAAALPRQRYQVILPVPELKDNEIFAPNYKNGEKVALIRYPHGGTFEIPILTVNNKHEKALETIGLNALDAVGINKNVADRLSGADFDGDTVMVIPTGKNVKISSTNPLKGLEGFDPKEIYPYHEGMKVMSESHKQRQMGVVSNLITDMTLKGATDDDLAAAVRHSMVVIDATKHKLDYRQSELDNNIAALKKKYQIQADGSTGGVATLISRAKSPVDIPKTQGSPKVNIKGTPHYDPTRPEGVLIFNTADDLEYKKRDKVKILDSDGKPKKDKSGNYIYETYINEKGNERYKYDYTGEVGKRTQSSTRMDQTDDATSLISVYQTDQEKMYARYANTMKRLARSCRLEAASIKTDSLYSKSASETYKKEVTRMLSALKIAEANAPRERRALTITNARVKEKMYADNDLTKSEISKISQQELGRARAEVGAHRVSIELSDREWEAIQAGAVRPTTLTRILKHVDQDKLRELATPNSSNGLSASKIALIRSLSDSNYSNQEIANRLGISASQVIYYLKKEDKKGGN